jgi:hypothetical protein
MTSGRALTVMLGAAALTAAGVMNPAVAAANDCVGGPGCRTSLQAAIDAAPPGATIRIAAGTYAGGVRIAKSLRLIGAGEGRTLIRGGGPVLTIETPSSTPPTVVISGLTVTGGVAHGDDGVNAFGGGILIDTGPEYSIGATVTLRDVAVSGNTTAPTAVSASPSGVKCPDGDCPYAGSRGGGIASFGRLTIERSVVTRNRAVGHASDAAGGGIYAANGVLTIRSSAVTDNTDAPAGIGRFAEAGGVFTSATTTTIQGSVVSGNRSELVTSWPIRPQGELLDMVAMGGGIHIADGGAAMIHDSTITGNSILADDPLGEIYAFGSGILVDGGSDLQMSRTTISKNRLQVRTATSEDVGPSGAAAEFDTAGEITDVQVIDNTSLVSTVDGQAQVSGAIDIFADNPQRLTLTRVAIRGNTAVARSRAGSALALGGGILNNGLMDLKSVRIQGNTAAAYAPTAAAQGGGIYNGPALFDQQVELTVSDSRITGNAVVTSGGGSAQGGGVYTTAPLTVTATRIAGNRPDQCLGC